MTIHRQKMRALSSVMFKILCSNQRAVYSTCNSIKSVSDLKKNISPEITEAIYLIKKYSLPIPWEKITKTLPDKDPNQVILKSCLELKDADTVMSYYKYLIDKGEHFNEINLFMIVNILSRCPLSQILKHEELIIYLFKDCKEFLPNSELLQSYAVELFSYIPYCYGELILMSKKNDTLFLKNNILINRAFDFDDDEVAWELLEKSNTWNDEILNSFINNCIRKALLNKFSVDLIQKFVDLCQKKGIIPYSTDILCSLQPLIHVLSHCQNEYIWSVRKCIVNSQMECVNCNTFLKEIRMNKHEFESLKSAVFENVIFGKDVYLKTSEVEWNKFKFFLRTCKPYDMVVDGLNFLYRGVSLNKKKSVAFLFQKFVREQKKRVLVIARKHFHQKDLFSNLPNIQFFFTDNSSDDDIFILYAAMERGLGTCVLTSDFFGSHAAKLDVVMKTLFIKWQLYHQYIFDLKFGIRIPCRHIGLSQCTDSPGNGKNSYKWHLTYQENNLARYSFRLQYNWVCLQATSKKDEEKNNLKINKTIRKM